MLRAEVEAMKLLKNNRHVVSYIDSHAAKSVTVEGNYEVFLLMEYCEKGGLIDFLNTRLKNRLRDDEVLRIMSQATQGIAAMHMLQPPLIHRDIKIENVLITANGDLKICDFGSVCGVVRPPRNNQELEYVRHDIMRNTTAQYRSPEMLNLTSGFPIDEKSDIWALGVFLYKICYYITPFEKVGESAILQARFQFPAMPIYNDRIKNLIKVMLAKLPTNRPNICQVLEEVSRIQGVPCTIKNFYLQRAVEFSKRNTISTFQSTSNMANVVTNMNINSNNHSIPTTIHHSAPMSNIGSSQFNSAMPSAQQNFSNIPIKTESWTTATPTLMNKIPRHTFDNSVPNLQHANTFASNHTKSEILNKPDLSILIQNSDTLSNNNFEVSRPTSPVRSHTIQEFVNSKTPHNMYIDGETQTLSSHSPVKKSLSRVSSIRSTFSLESDGAHMEDAFTDNNDNLARKISYTLKNVLTGESRNTSPIRSRQNTGDSLWNTAVSKLRSGLTGGSTKRSISYDKSTNKTNTLNRRISSMIRDTEGNHNDETIQEESGNTFLQPTQHSLDFQNGRSPIKLIVNKQAKESIQKKVQNLLNNSDDIPTRRTASGYGKYTNIESPTKTKQNTTSNKPNIMNSNRKSSVIVTPLTHSQNKHSSALLNEKRKHSPPPVPNKPSGLKSRIRSKLKKESTGKNRIASDTTDILMDVDVDDLETSFRQRFPSTVR
ncbi:hypothetical protein C6P45_002115 [Maudiozyma exigua]|uniref:non-specific serine/threonine protein kinase n=1 Tax=Maudiozyma exigua TaxID=34358 RepID=A0A9P6WCU2_MAUEX|nr:hypothetical protein C6P45_002115 [Kazachstania exigua]